MKIRFSARGYIRTILLSILAACIIEGIINADEVRIAFTKGREIKKATETLQEAGSNLLKVPQQLSRVAGRVYHMVFE